MAWAYRRDGARRPRRGDLRGEVRRLSRQNGKEGPNDVLVGREPRDVFPSGRDTKVPRTIGNYWPYATTVFDYVRRAMPPDAPGR